MTIDARRSEENGSRLPSSELVYQGVKSRILDNVFPPGFQILEQDLAKIFEVSRTPVREALLRLEGEGLVEVVPRHGMRVYPISLADMKEIYEILSSLEPKAAELVAERHLRDEEIFPLEQSANEMAEALEDDDLDRWANADEQFHRSLVELCGNRRLTTMVMNCWAQSHRARMVTLRIRPRPVKSTMEHIAIVDAIKKGDAKRANELFRKHRERGGKAMMDILKLHQLAAEPS